MARRKSQTDIADEPAHKTSRRSASRYRVPLPDRHRSRTKNSVAPGADGDSIDAMGLEPMPSSSMFEAAAEQRQQKNQQAHRSAANGAPLVRGRARSVL